MVCAYTIPHTSHEHVHAHTTCIPTLLLVFKVRQHVGIASMVANHIASYRIARNVGGAKNWRIPLKTTLAKKTLAIWQ